MAVQLLSGVLAGLVGLGSVTLYLAAFFFPEVHRRHDFFWSGVGCFYALILWLNASQITPTELVGHLASISLMGWLGWQTLTLRRKRTPLAQQTPYNADSWPTFRREMTALALDALRQTPLRRWLPAPAAVAAPMASIRVSALKDVGYEFVDSVEAPADLPSPKVLGGAGSTVTPLAPLAPPSASLSPKTPQVSPRPAASPPPATMGKKGMTWGQRTQGLVTWVQDVVRAKTAPKPKKPVIEIPPRPSSLAKRSASLDQSSVSPPQVSTPQASPSQPPTPPPSTQPPIAQDTPDTPTTQAAQAAPNPPKTQESSNWDDDDEDWI